MNRENRLMGAAAPRVSATEAAFISGWARGAVPDGSATPDGGLRAGTRARTGALLVCGALGEAVVGTREGGIVSVSRETLATRPYAKALSASIAACPAPLDEVIGLMEGEVATAAADGLRELAASSRSVLKHVIALHKLYQGTDPQLSSKEARTAMSAILREWEGVQDSTPLLAFGRRDWEPDPLAWMAFFDGVGTTPLGEFLGISAADEIPEAPGPREEEPESLPSYDHDANEPESDTFDATDFLQ